MHTRLSKSDVIQLEGYYKNQIEKLKLSLNERWARVAWGQYRELICHVRLHHLGDLVSFLDFDRFTLLPKNSIILTDNYNKDLKN